MCADDWLVDKGLLLLSNKEGKGLVIAESEHPCCRSRCGFTLYVEREE